MNRETLFVVRYKGTWGDDEVMEVIVDSYDDFIKWLAEHNESRREDYLDDDDFCEETEDHFDLIPLEFFKS